jgi:cytidylate kinase
MRSSGIARNVIISGLTASGTTTHGKLLAQEYGLEYISASQTLLKLAGLRSDQPLDFWVTKEGLHLTKNTSWTQVDDEFCRLEAQSDTTLFDCLSLPWLHSQNCMVIWLESSLPARLMKAIVSHKGETDLTVHQVEKRIKRKDRLARNKIMEAYGVHIFRDRSPFDLIIDNSSFITAPTEGAAWLGIRKTQEILSSAVGWYLYADQSSWRRLQAALAVYGTQVIQRYPREPLGTSVKWPTLPVTTIAKSRRSGQLRWPHSRLPA